MTQQVCLIGATSSLGFALSHLLAQKGHTLVLVGRQKDELGKLQSDLTIRYATKAICFPSLGTTSFSMDHFKKIIGNCDIVVMLVGSMGKGAQDDPEDVAAILESNLVLPARLLSAIIPLFEKRRKGSLVVISSVAGDRGRQSNYPYGSAKAGLTTFAAGIRHRLAKHKVHVMTVKLGYTDTPMTYGMDSPLIADRFSIARLILTALAHKKTVVYIPWYWRDIMAIIKALPDWLFHKTSL